MISHPGLLRAPPALRGSLWIFAAESLMLPTGVLTAAFLSRKLGVAGYGQFLLAAGIVIWIEWTISALFSRATVKLASEAPDWRPVGTTALRLHLITSLAIAALLWMLADLIAAWLAEPAIAGYLRLFALDLPIFCLAHAHRNLLIGLGQVPQRAIGAGSRWVARLIFIVVLVELGLSIEGAILGSIAASAVELAINRWAIRPALFARLATPIGHVLRLLAPLFLAALCLRLFDVQGLVLIKALGGTVEQVAFYGAAQNLSIVAGIFAMSFSPVLLARLAGMARDHHLAAVRQTVRDAWRWIMVLLPLAAVGIGAAPEIVILIYGSEFAPAAPILSLLIVAAWSILVISVATAIFVGSDQPRWTILLAGPLFPAGLLGHLLLIPPLGAIGAAMTTAIVSALGAGAAIVWVNQLWRVWPAGGTLVRSCLISAAGGALAAIWPSMGLALLLKLAIIGTLIGAAFWFSGELSAAERASLSALCHRVIPARKPEGVPKKV